MKTLKLKDPKEARAIVYNLVHRYRKAKEDYKRASKIYKDQYPKTEAIYAWKCSAKAAKIEAWNSLQAARNILYNRVLN